MDRGGFAPQRVGEVKRNYRHYFFLRSFFPFFIFLGPKTFPDLVIQEISNHAFHYLLFIGRSIFEAERD